ncbi:MAG: hypothetical protein ACK5E1_14005, partial [Bradyrhizobium sp.]
TPTRPNPAPAAPTASASPREVAHPPQGGSNHTAHQARRTAIASAERLEWWDELFEPPCVGFATSREEAEAFAAAGADFVLVGDVIWSDPRGARAALVEIGEAITRAHADTFGTAKAEG